MMLQFRGEFVCITQCLCEPSKFDETCPTCSHEKLVTLHNGLRKDRDDLWNEVDHFRSEVSVLLSERNELKAKLDTLRGEVKHSLDDVVQERERQIKALTLQNEDALDELKTHYENVLTDIRLDHDAKLKGERRGHTHSSRTLIARGSLRAVIKSGFHSFMQIKF
jgi:hypothetical protein